MLDCVAVRARTVPLAMEGDTPLVRDIDTVTEAVGRRAEGEPLFESVASRGERVPPLPALGLATRTVAVAFTVARGENEIVTCGELL